MTIAHHARAWMFGCEVTDLPYQMFKKKSETLPEASDHKPE
jgi:hypothetical protein